MRYVIQNEWLRCEIASHGAEIKSLQRKADSREIMWGADPAFWGRTAPVLFPFVGAVKDKKYRHEGKEYVMGQHGFARDMEFTLASQKEEEIWFYLTDSAETMENYPFHFRLRIGYRLEKESVRVLWQVENANDGEMWFSIGAHPGFAVPSLEGHSFWLYDQIGKPLAQITNRVFGQGGCVTDQTQELTLTDGELKITEALFANDALVLENGQVGRVELRDENRKLIVALEFTAPLMGLWSPPHKNAPFVCIEPWYGRCDSESFSGELSEREYEQRLGAGEGFHGEYVISV
ncbi:MAG: aldose 1-epimerase family protein [Acetatifactor sp.]|nr:aldose 1-epimerase family protein [Acetatifactor sp.]